MIYHVIRTVKVWPVDQDYTFILVFAMSGLFLLLAALCAIELIRRLK